MESEHPQRPVASQDIPDRTGQRVDRVHHAQRTLWLGMCFIIGAGLVVAIILIF